MVRIIWSPDAADDLEAICDYIAKDSDYYARVFANGVIRAIEIVAITHGARLIE